MTFVSPEPFVDPVYDGLSDDAEVAVAQVEEEFFKRAADLDPRVDGQIGRASCRERV